MKNSKTGYKKKIHRSNVMMICMVIGSILLFNVINYISVNRYTNAVDGLSTLSSFYSDSELYTQYLKEYLHTNNKDYFTKIQKLKGKMDKATLWLIEESSTNNKWQFEALRNMYLTHMDTAEKLVNSYQKTTSNYETYYDKFLKEDELILDTTKEYYGLLTDMIHDHLSSLEMIAFGTFIISIVDFVIIVIWLLYYSSQLTKFLAKPLELISNNIKSIREGKYDLSNVSDTGKEMEDICNALNDMGRVVQQNMKIAEEKADLEKRLLTSENEILKRDERLAVSELKMLQNQINPHFLFNTLNMIYRMAINEGAYDASEMLIKTSQLLRYGLDNQKQISSLGKEIEMIKQYIDIQKKRFGQRVQFIIDCNCEDLYELHMPGLIFQPLVENALIHGLHDTMDGGEVVICANKDYEYLRLSVADNGKGMVSEQLEELILNDYQKKEGNHLGLYNVIKRMEMYFKDRIMINVYSSEGCGFEVCMEIRLAERKN